LKNITHILECSRFAQKQWQDLGLGKRCFFFQKLKAEILKNLDDLARVISEENGKPLLEAISHDVLPVMDLIAYLCKNAKKFLRKEKICLGKWNLLGKSSHLEQEPYGVVGIISPWNFPFSIPVGEIVTALIAGNAVILKPSEHTPRVNQKIKDLFQRIKFPENIFQMIEGGADVGATLVASEVDKIMFTGSVLVGKKIMTECAKTLKPLTLELGGKDPFLVFEDADLDVASSAAVWGAFCNSGQVCSSVERVYVQNAIMEKFLNLVVEKTKKIRLEDLGPLTLDSQAEKVEQQLSQAKAKGAKILFGGERDGKNFSPTILVNADHTMTIMKEETFGPVLPVMSFTTEAQAIQLSNDSPYGLNVYVWTKDRARARRVAKQLQAGTININETVFTHALPQTPWGGVKQSGFGRTHGRLGLLDLVKVKHVHVNRCPKKKNFFWWYPYTNDKVQMLRDLARALFGKGFKRVFALVKFLRKSSKAKVD